MEIVVLVLGLVGFVMSFVLVGAIPAVLAVILGSIRLMLKKKHLAKLGRIEIIIGIVFAVIAIIISVYIYVAGVMDIDFVNIIRQETENIINILPF